MEENLDTQKVVEENLPTSNFDQDLLDSLRVNPTYNEPILHQILRIAIYDEYHAYENYRVIVEKFGSQTPFINILQAEINHYEELTVLLNKYQVPAPLNDWVIKVETPNSILEAAEVGVAEEIDNIKMYDNLITYAKDYPDVLDLLYRLQAASYNNHLPALRQAVAKHSNLNVSEVDVNTIHQENSIHNIDEAISKMDEISAMASKFSTGNVSQEDILKLLSNSNLSFVGGALLGAVGAGVFSQVTKDKKENATEEEEV